MQYQDIISEEYTYVRHAISYIRNPLSTLLGWLIGKGVVMCQQDDDYVNYTKFRDIKNADGGTTKYSYFKTGNDSANGVFVFFHGNATELRIMDNYMRSAEFKQKYKYVVSVFHPKQVTTLKTEIDAGEELIKHLLKNEGVQASDLTIAGMSLGGGIGAQVLNRFRTNGVLQNGEQFDKYLNYQSFTSISDTGARFLCTDRKSIIFKCLSYIISAVLNFAGMELDTLSVLQKPDLPVSNVSIVYDKNDHFMKVGANALTPEAVGIATYNYHESSFKDYGGRLGTHCDAEDDCNYAIGYTNMTQHTFTPRSMSIAEQRWEDASTALTLSNWTSLQIAQDGFAALHDYILHYNARTPLVAHATRL